MSKEKIKKRIEELTRNINLAQRYKQELRKRKRKLDEKLRNKEISLESYKKKLGNWTKNYSYWDIINYYNYYNNYCTYLKNKYEEKLKFIRIKSIATITIILTVLLLSTSLIVKQSNITGLVIFTETKEITKEQGITINKSYQLNLNTASIPEIIGVRLSGKIIGKGEVEIYLKNKNKTYLVYKKINRNKTTLFKDKCIETCNLEKPIRGNITLIFKINKSKLVIDKIKYIEFNLLNFELIPKEIKENFVPGKVIRYNISITNKENKKITLAIYQEGELARYITLEKSLITLGKGTKKIGITINMPLRFNNSGTHKSKIIARYIPKGEFTGETPKDESTIRLFVPYEGALIKPELNINDGMQKEFIIKLENIGSKDIRNIITRLEVYKENKKIESLEEKVRELKKGETKYLKIKGTKSYEEGVYNITTKIIYDNKVTTINKTTILKRPRIIISNIKSMPYFYENETEIKISIKSNIGNSTTLYAKAEIITNDGRKIDEYYTEKTDIKKNEEITMSAYFNNKRYKIKTGKLKITIFYKNTKEEYYYPIKIRETIEIEKESKEKLSPINHRKYWLIIVAAIILINIALITKRLKNKKIIDYIKTYRYIKKNID